MNLSFAHKFEYVSAIVMLVELHYFKTKYRIIAVRFCNELKYVILHYTTF